MKSLPLYVGALFIAVAVAGGVVSLLDEPASRQPQPQSQPAAAAAEAEPARPATVEEALSPEEVKAQDDADIKEILLGQIAATPADINVEWIADFCQHIRDEAALAVFWSELVEKGRRYDAQYTAQNAGTGHVLSRNPLFYVFEAREYIHTDVPDDKKLLKQARGLMAMAVFRSWHESREVLRKQLSKTGRIRLEDVVLPDDAGTIDTDIKTTYFTEMLALYELLAKLEGAKENGGNPRQYGGDLVRLHEAAIADRYFSIGALTKEAQDRFRGTGQSSGAAMMTIDRLQSGVDEHLLALGKIYIREALAEKTYRGKQQASAEQAFQALALVFQRTSSGEALREMMEANRIHRYNLWQLARASWQRAKKAAADGRREEANDEFFLAKQRYLQCLGRLERSKKPVVYDEYRRLQSDINDWMASRDGAPVAAAEG